MALGTGTDVVSLEEGEDTQRRQIPDILSTGIRRGVAVAPGAGKVPLADSEVPGSTKRSVSLPSHGATDTTALPQP